MCRFIESIRVEDGRLLNLDYHQRRLDATLCVHAAGSHIALGGTISVPPECASGLFKCRVVYSSHVHLVEFVPYERKPVRSVAPADGSGIGYPVKFENRSALDALKTRHPRSDEIIIVKGGVITDSHAANLVFEKSGTLVTPSDVLLAGTMRAKLLDEGVITAQRLYPCDIQSFDRIHFINAMNALGERTFDLSRTSALRTWFLL